jgi:hypothetical protein
MLLGFDAFGMRAMKTAQRGMGFISILLLLIAIVVVAIGGMKVVPAYLEYFAVKKAVAGMMQSGELRNSNVGEVRRSFDKRANVDDIRVISGADLEVTKDGNEIVVSFAYPKKVQLFGNVSLLIEFAGTSQPGSTKAKGD